MGLAVSDRLGLSVRPLLVIDAKRVDPVERIAEIVEKEGVEKVIVGYPLSWRHEETPRCAEVKGFFRKLRKRLSVPVVLVDEWGTSKGARDDAEAAARLLREYLEGGEGLELEVD